jgi:hypothetical protein
MAGVPELRAAIADKVAALYGADYDVETKSRSPPVRRRRSSRRLPPSCAAATR